MKKIGLTGNIAAGKSAAEKIIKNLGYLIIDADEICHQLLADNQIIRNKIKEIFKNENILDENNNLDRKKIGEIVFNNIHKRKELESILHPEILTEIKKFCKNNTSQKLIFMSIPLLFETKMERNFDKIILICADKDIRLNRLIQRNNYTKEYALLRINSQQNQEEKIKKSDFVIWNNDSLKALEKEIKKVLNDLKN